MNDLLIEIRDNVLVVDERKYRPLVVGKSYYIQVSYCNGKTRVYVDGKRVKPLAEGAR